MTHQDPSDGPVSQVLHGWGRTSPTRSHVVRPTNEDEVRDLLTSAAREGGRGLLARGQGRSYGDVAQNAGGTVLDMSACDRVHQIDVEDGLVVVDAGVTLDHLLRTLLPLGLTLPVQPGTRHVSVGGALACDVHGKNHHVAGSFARHVLWCDLVTPDGVLRRISPTGSGAELFWATAGGLGLTGVLVRVSLALRHVETSRIVVRTERHRDLGSVMDALEEQDATADYSVAWFDSVATGRSSGRGIVMTGRDARVEDLPSAQRRRPLALPGDREIGVPSPPVSLVTRSTARLFNEAYFRRAPARPTTTVQHGFGFFQPLDGLAGWNRLYGPRGFAQYQLVVPDRSKAAVAEVVRTVAASGHASCLNVLKRFGAASPGLLSFPSPGWTLALDLPVRPGLSALLDRLDALVVEAGGRVYLAKDSRLPRELLTSMYPRLPEFLQLRSTLDPAGLMTSDMVRRLGLHPTSNEG
ncbi:MAG: putative decaprenylphosphoryl-beta-D-ribose oxidase [Marmoricola sp.]|nr:putative decaprenylphosphoryl-beta-D-ribose oxidase [Marmoricola sp.]